MGFIFLAYFQQSDNMSDFCIFTDFENVSVIALDCTDTKQRTQNSNQFHILYWYCSGNLPK